VSIYTEEAVKTVLSCAETIETRGQSLMIIRDVQANEVGKWLKHIAAELRASCEPEEGGEACPTTPTAPEAS